MSIGIHAFVSGPISPLVCGYCGREEYDANYHGDAPKGEDLDVDKVSPGFVKPTEAWGDSYDSITAPRRIRHLEAQSAALHETIANLSSRCESLQAENAQLRIGVTDFSGDADALEIQVRELEAELARERELNQFAKSAMEDHVSDGKHVGPRSEALHEAIRRLTAPKPADTKEGN